MLEIIVIADDLTGAADVGVQFLEMTGHSLKIVGLDHKISPVPSRGLALNTQTRNESPLIAKLLMDRATDLIRRLEPTLIYKKIDASLRGNVGLELGALVRNLKFRGALVAPAYPAFGSFAARLVRSTKPGSVFICGGDTAQAILSSLNLHELWLRNEILPGTVYMEAGRTSIITKIGSFGPPDILVKLQQSLK